MHHVYICTQNEWKFLGNGIHRKTAINTNLKFYFWNVCYMDDGSKYVGTWFALSYSTSELKCSLPWNPGSIRYIILVI